MVFRRYIRNFWSGTDLKCKKYGSINSNGSLVFSFFQFSSRDLDFGVTVNKETEFL